MGYSIKSLPTLYLGIQIGGACWWIPRITWSRKKPGRKSQGMTMGWLLFGIHAFVNHHDDLD
jgi:hypothetical protein